MTAALGAAAYAGLPLTHRKHASAVAFVTGHEKPGKAESLLDWAALARFPGTLVVYMGMARLPHVVAQPASTTAWAPRHAGGGGAMGDDRPAATVEAPLCGFAEAVAAAGSEGAGRS